MPLNLNQLPNAARCALEVFANSGERTKSRLTALLDHYLNVTGLASDPDRGLYEESLVHIAKRRYALGESEGF